MRQNTYKLTGIFFVLFFLVNCNREKTIPLDSMVWGSWDVTIDNRRYNMSVWMIKSNWFESKTKQDIIENLPEKNPYAVENDIKIFCVKETDGWNIDFIPHSLAYLDIYFGDNNEVVRVLLREREQTFREKMDGKGRVSSEKFKTILVWMKNKKLNITD